MDLWSIGGGSSASRSAKFGVVIFTASLLMWSVNLSYIHATLLHLPCQLTIDPCYIITPFPCQLTIDPYYTITPHKSAQGICALCYMWNVCGVVVFYGYMVDWRRVWGQSVMQLMQCSGLSWIYGQLEEGAGFSLLWKLFGVMVFQRSMLNWLGVHWPK